MSYKPVFAGDSSIRDEFDRISAAIDELLLLRFPTLYVAPEKPVYGQVAIPDGVHWNPLGTGDDTPAWFDGVSWNPLGGDGGGTPGVTDHGALTGLLDDDHPQYHTDARGDARYSPLVHTHDHGSLTGLSDDDHSQYVLRSILTTNGDLFTRVAGAVARLGVGSASQVLTVVSGAPAWAAPAGVTDHGALTGLSDDDHPQYQDNLQFKDEGTNLGTPGSVSTVNFTGAGVTATESGGVVTVDIPVGAEIIIPQKTDLVINSNNVFQNTELVINLGVGSFEIEIDWWAQSHATPDMEIRSNYTGTIGSSRTNRFGAESATGTLSVTSTTTVVTATLAATGTYYQKWTVFLTTSTSGTFSIQARQITSSGNDVFFFKGSKMRVSPA